MDLLSLIGYVTAEYFTMIFCVLDKFDFSAMVTADRVFGPLIFFFYAVTVTFILLNFFITIIVTSFAEVIVI